MCDNLHFLVILPYVQLQTHQAMLFYKGKLMGPYYECEYIFFIY